MSFFVACFITGPKKEGSSWSGYSPKIEKRKVAYRNFYERGGVLIETRSLADSDITYKREQFTRYYDKDIEPVFSLGVVFDSDFNFRQHISLVIKSCSREG